MNRPEVEHVARLARIALTPEESERMVRELGAVLEYVGVLDGLGLDADPPLAHVSERFAPPREDVALPERCLPRDRVLAAAPLADGAFFLVPTVVDTRG